MADTTRNYADECGDHGGTNSAGEPCGRLVGVKVTEIVETYQAGQDAQQNGENDS